MATALRIIDTELDEARKRCADLLRKATGPMHVAQADGTTLRLCYLGRIMRAHTMIDTATPEARPRILARYAELVKEANEAWADYMAARDAYLARVQRLGIEADEPLERECNCVVCVAYEPPTVHLGDEEEKA